MARRLPTIKTIQRRLRELVTSGRNIGLLLFYLAPAHHRDGALVDGAAVEALATTIEATLQGHLGVGFREGDLLARGNDGTEWFVFLASPPRSKQGLTRRDLQEVERRVARELRANIREALPQVPRASLPPLRSGAAVLEYDPTLSLPLQLEEARSEARLHGEVSRLLDDQLSGLNHKIRTPLTTMKGVIEILRHDPEALGRFLKTLESEVDRIQRLLEQFSLVTRIQSGLFDWVIQDADARELLGHVIDKLRPLAHSLGVQIEVNIDPRDDFHLRGTVEILEEAFRQIIDNAIRYGARGKAVKVTALATPTHVIVQVADRGPGIPKEDLPFIFQPFYVVGQDPDTQAQGGGLGLCLARGVMEVHGGDLECDSERGGTTMTLRFPRDFERSAPHDDGGVRLRRKK